MAIIVLVRRLSFLVLCGLVAAAPQLAPMGGDRTLVGTTASSIASSFAIAPKVIEVDVDAETRGEVEPVIEDAALAIPPAARACGGEAIEVQPVAARPEKQPPRLGLGTCN